LAAIALNAVPQANLLQLVAIFLKQNPFAQA